MWRGHTELRTMECGKEAANIITATLKCMQGRSVNRQIHLEDLSCLAIFKKFMKLGKGLFHKFHAMKFRKQSYSKFYKFHIKWLLHRKTDIN